MAATQLYILIEGGLVSGMAADGSIDVHVIDADNAKIGEPNTEQWQLAKGEGFEDLRRMYDRAIEREIIEHAAGCSGDCETMPDGLLACATPIEELHG